MDSVERFFGLLLALDYILNWLGTMKISVDVILIYAYPKVVLHHVVTVNYFNYYFKVKICRSNYFGF